MIKKSLTDPELLDIEAACRFFGGTRPIHPATLYRGVRDRLYPKPIKIGRSASRWLKDECVAALEKLAAQRGA
jgi:predicted DNA-binding transcriptional regulator AlpA